MASPLSDNTFLSIAKASGRISEVGNWRNHNRNPGRSWGPINGVVIHHTGSDTSSPSAYAKNILYNGYAGLPGPLCQVGIGKDGTIYLCSNGRANHAGGGDPNVLNKVIAENIGSTELKPHRGNLNGVDGNSRFYGAEIMYSGGHPMSQTQYDSATRWAANICRHYGWSSKSVIGHREWSSDKPDPGYCDMTRFRSDVQRLLNGQSASLSKVAAKVSSSKSPSASKEPSPSKGTDMPTPKDLWNWDGIPAPDPKAANKYWMPKNYLREIYRLLLEIRTLVKANK